MENQTRFDLSSPRARIFGAVAFLVAFYVWRSLVYVLWEVFTSLPMLTAGTAHGFQTNWGWFIALDVFIGCPLIVLAARPQLANAAILRTVSNFLFRSAWGMAAWVGLALLAVRCLSFFAWRAAYPDAVKLTSAWGNLYGWPNLYPGLLLCALFYLHPSRVRASLPAAPLIPFSDALENWRRELEAQPGLSAETRRELEAHLRDAMADFQQAGLSEEGSFFRARQRVGSPTQLSSEFAKNQPFTLTRETILWGAMSFLGIFFWQRIVIDLVLYSWAGGRRSPEPFIQLMTWLPPFLLALLAARTRVIARLALLKKIVSNRNRFAVSSIVLLVFESYLEILRMHLRWDLFYQANMKVFLPVLYTAVWPLLLSVIAFFLMPSKSSSPESAWKAIAQ
jgi:hypothetical protein